MPATWKTTLRLLLQKLAAESGQHPRVAVLGIGNTFRSDDAAGVLVARALSRRVSDNAHLLVCEAGHAPENKTAEVRKFAPDLVLLIDAADLGKAPGTVEWISEEDIDGMSASTHSLPLSMLARYLKLEIGCEVNLLGIQLASNEVGETISPEVLQAVEEVAAGLDEIICDCISVSSLT
ncbi:MAG TPA: hydrogenase 3 maturation endopeptidase HyCI [Anaerolineales bacterium]|nr:hydrogenase 3 maturation endopeptidase HyCI [Anaerolineales bacterium]